MKKKPFSFLFAKNIDPQMLEKMRISQHCNTFQNLTLCTNVIVKVKLFHFFQGDHIFDILFAHSFDFNWLTNFPKLSVQCRWFPCGRSTRVGVMMLNFNVREKAKSINNNIVSNIWVGICTIYSFTPIQNLWSFVNWKRGLWKSAYRDSYQRENRLVFETFLSRQLNLQVLKCPNET